MYRLVFTSDKLVEHYIGKDFKIYIESHLKAVDENNIGFTSSRVLDSTAIVEAGIIAKTINAIYIFAYVGRKSEVES
jgi:hypothetical protein